MNQIEFTQISANLEGLKKAEVVFVDDPKKLERVRVRVVGIHDMNKTDLEYSIWAEHIAPSRKTSGDLPEVGDYVYVLFDKNNPLKCYWIGFCRYIEGGD